MMKSQRKISAIKKELTGQNWNLGVWLWKFTLFSFLFPRDPSTVKENRSTTSFIQRMLTFVEFTFYRQGSFCCFVYRRRKNHVEVRSLDLPTPAFTLTCSVILDESLHCCGPGSQPRRKWGGSRTQLAGLAPVLLPVLGCWRPTLQFSLPLSLHSPPHSCLNHNSISSLPC